MTTFTLWFVDDWTPIAAGALGIIWGFAADRLAARWPEHEDGLVRRIDWRTLIVTAVSAAAFAATVARFGGDPRALLIVGAFVATLVVLFATDLDQRLLPDVITLPMIPLAAIVTFAGASPFIHTNDDVLWAAVAAVVIPLGLALLAIPFGAGAIGQGDLKLLVSVGLLTGGWNLFYGLVSGAILAGAVILVLVIARRLTLRSFVPYGPFLIAGILWAILALSPT